MEQSGYRIFWHTFQHQRCHSSYLPAKKFSVCVYTCSMMHLLTSAATVMILIIETILVISTLPALGPPLHTENSVVDEYFQLSEKIIQNAMSRSGLLNA